MEREASASNRDLYVRKFAVGGSADELGGKGYRLAELYRAGFPVPEGFILVTKAFDKMRQLNTELRVPDPIYGLIFRLYKEIFGSSKIAVRSSAVTEDGSDASFAGLFASVLDVNESSLRSAIDDVYRSVFSPEVTDYVRSRRLTIDKIRMAVVCQRQIEPQFAGVCFTAHPVSGERQFIIEFARGHSADLVSGRVGPSRIVFDTSFVVVEKSRDRGFPDDQITVFRSIAETADKVADFLGEPQDIEWAINSAGLLFILQSRPITTFQRDAHQRALEKEPPLEGELIARGLGVSPGIANGPVRKILADLTGTEAERLLQPGDIAVGHALRIDHLPAIAKCAGVISLEASMLSHVAIRARELGIPCVGGISHALSLAQDGVIITLDGTHGNVYRGHAHQPSLDAGSASTGYDPSTMRTLETQSGRIIYEQIDDTVTVFLKKPLDTRIREDAIQAAAAALKISPLHIDVDEHVAWESAHAPSIVYMQQQIFESFQRNPRFVTRLARAREITARLDTPGLHIFVDEADSEAKDLFSAAVHAMNTLKKSKNRETAERAAQLFDDAKKLAGDFIGITVIDVLGESVVRHHTTPLTARYGITLVDVFTISHRPAQSSNFDKSKTDPSITSFGLSQEDTREFYRLADYANALSELKNRRYEILSVNNYTGIDLIRDFLANDLGDLVERYRW